MPPALNKVPKGKDVFRSKAKMGYSNKENSRGHMFKATTATYQLLLHSDTRSWFTKSKTFVLPGNSKERSKLATSCRVRQGAGSQHTQKVMQRSFVNYIFLKKL
jgi:hypothetical protein